MRTSDVMMRQVLSIEPGASVLQAVRLMLQNRISGLPVVTAGGALVGILTEGDLLRRTETATEKRRPRWLEFLIGPGALAGEYVQTHARKVDEIMTPDPRTIAEDTPLDEVVQIMEKHQIKRLPVMRGKQLVGIVSRANLLHALASMAPSAPAPAGTDQAIRDRLLTELEHQKWAPVGAINVIVKDGVVELWGTITDERERQALIVAAENIPGVKEVQDNLAWIDAMSGLVLLSPAEAKAS
jgi:CBS domain-containing protein